MPQQPPRTSGPIHAVPCPHCGKPHDMREFAGIMDTRDDVQCLPPDGEDGTGYCGRTFRIVAIQEVTMVTVHPIHQPKPNVRGPGGAAPAKTIGDGIRRLLGGK